jgi:hypothetical protein
MEHSSAPARIAPGLALAAFVVCLAFHFWGVQVGWQSKNLPGVEYRQAQTALSAYWIKAENNFSLAYPTPVLGKPWSIPMEFPLYQWTVVALSRATGLDLIKAGRVVSQACFYLTLPAVFLLLARWTVAGRHRWLVLATIVTCPFYIFYARAFLMETMALMFSVWFWVAFERAVASRSRGWLAVAILAGTGAGLVKVTTFLLYLLPAGGWAWLRLWSRRKEDWKTEFTWMAAAVAVPFAATFWWLRYADAAKALNPLAGFLRSENLQDFNWGTHETRFSAELWALKGHILWDSITWLPAVAICLLAALTVQGRRWQGLALCLGLFVVPLVVFPVLYALHEYYFIANTMLLLVCMGLTLVALAESRLPRGFIALAVLAITGGQVARYLVHYYPTQKMISHGGDGLSLSLNSLTRPDEYSIITGQDWNSMTAFYAQRRALMLRRDTEYEPARVRLALAALAGEKLGALAVTGPWENRPWLIQQVVALGLEATPLYYWRDVAVFLPASRRHQSLASLEENVFPEVRYAPGVELPPELMASAEKLDDRWYELEKLRPSQRRFFRYMQPMPVRFYSRFGPGLNFNAPVPEFGVHPLTQLVFALPAGRHTLRSSAHLPPASYQADLAREDKTDGIEVTLARRGAGGVRQILGRVVIDPRDVAADRQWVPFQWEFELAGPGEVELTIGPGPAGRDTRDWASLGPLVIE